MSDPGHHPSTPPAWLATNSVPMDVEARLHQLEIMVNEAKNVPLSASMMLNRGEVEGLVAELRESLPEELRQARWILKEREELLDKARRDAAQILEDAEAQRARLLSRTEVVRAANREADRIIDDAHEHARQIRLEAEDYVDAKLANFEVVLQKTLAAVERGRQKLRGRLDVEELAEYADQEEEGDEDWPEE
ncbi:MAG TPA: hypothetical protein VHF25_16485 [Nitriliruptorales bacterium]|nr:hypothetical protein [Nitriliruptorales bacterium]